MGRTALKTNLARSAKSMFSLILIFSTLERDSAMATCVLHDLYDGNMSLMQQCSEVLPTQRSCNHDRRMKGSAAIAKMDQVSGEQVFYKVIISLSLTHAMPSDMLRHRKGTLQINFLILDFSVSRMTWKIPAIVHDLVCGILLLPHKTKTNPHWEDSLHTYPWTWLQIRR